MKLRFALLWCLGSMMGVQVYAQAPLLVEYRGQLQDKSGSPASGLFKITFSIYAQQDSIVPLWSELQDVTVSAGRYRVVLGAANDNEGIPDKVFNGEPRWLGICVEDHEDGSRIMLVSVPYSLKAEDAQTLAGHPLSDFVLVKPAAHDDEAESRTIPRHVGGFLHPSGRSTVTSTSSLESSTGYALQFTATADPGPGFVSLAASGPPFFVNSRAEVPNLNSNYLEGRASSYFSPALTFNSPLLNSANSITVLPASRMGPGVVQVGPGLSVDSLGNLSASTYFTDVRQFGAKGDGVTDDTAAINTALASLPASGGTIVFPSGTYLISSTLVIAKSGVTLRGVQGSSIIQQAAGASGPCILVDKNQSRVTVRNMVLRTNAAGVNIALEIDYGANNPTKDDLIENVYFQVFGIGVEVTPADSTSSWNKIHIVNCRFDLSDANYNPSASETGVLVNGNSGTIPTPIDLAVESCVWTDSGHTQTAISIRGPLAESFISQCRFAGASDGIYIIGQVEGIHITDNSFISNGRSVDIPGSAGDVFIVGNEFDQILTVGVQMSGINGGLGLQGILVSNCTFFTQDDNSIGVSLISGSLINSLFIQGNKFAGLGGSNTTAVQLAGSVTNGHISNNIVNNLTGSGLVISGSSDHLVLGNNEINIVGGDGIRVGAAITTFSISGNEISNAGGMGVNVSGPSDFGSVFGQTLSQVSGQGISLGSATARVSVGMNNTGGAGISYGGATNVGGNL